MLRQEQYEGEPVLVADTVEDAYQALDIALPQDNPPAILTTPAVVVAMGLHVEEPPDEDA